MKPLEPPDSPHLQAAQGWFELHAFAEADAKYPASRLFRLAGPQNPLADVFICVVCQPLDIKGFRPVKDMYFNVGVHDPGVEEVAAQTVRDHFYHHFNDDQLEAARAALREYSEANPSLFPAPTQLG